MNIDAKGILVKNLLRKGKFIIPDYQREYDWDKNNLDEFFEDLMQNEKGYFIGHMVCEERIEGEEFIVIDGQQRLTTITIMLSVLRDLFFEKSEENLALGINDNYIFGKNEENRKYVVLENKMPYPLLQKYVQNIPVNKEEVQIIKNGEKKIKNAYDKFKKEWKEFNIEKLKDIRDRLLDLELVLVVSEDAVDAFTVFETINDRGKDLTPLDLIKNQIFKNYPKETHINEPEDSWKEFLELVNKNEITFIKNFWASIFKKVSERKLYKEFVQLSRNEGFNYKKFLEDLKFNASIYSQIINTKSEDWNADEFKIFLSLDALNLFNIKVSHSFLLSLIREYKKNAISKKYVIKALKTIERFHYINNAIIGGRSSGLDNKYSKFAIELYRAQNREEKHRVLNDLIRELNSKLPTIEEFEVSFDKRLYYLKNKEKYKKLVLYTLKKLEYDAQNYNVELKNISLEHIYPENFSTSCWNDIDEKYIGSIGNLVLLDSNLNSRVGNNCFQDKKRLILEKSKIITTKEVFENNGEWNEQAIKNRRKELVENLYNL